MPVIYNSRIFREKMSVLSHKAYDSSPLEACLTSQIYLHTLAMMNTCIRRLYDFTDLYTQFS